MVGLGAFKQYVGLWFHQGVFLSDEEKVLINAQEGTSKGLRQWRFKDISEMDSSLLKTYVLEAIENQKKGLEIKVVRKKEYEMPNIFKQEFDSSEPLNKAFYSFTFEKQREFVNYIK